MNKLIDSIFKTMNCWCVCVENAFIPIEMGIMNPNRELYVPKLIYSKKFIIQIVSSCVINTSNVKVCGDCLDDVEAAHTHTYTHLNVAINMYFCVVNRLICIRDVVNVNEVWFKVQMFIHFFFLLFLLSSIGFEHTIANLDELKIFREQAKE